MVRRFGFLGALVVGTLAIAAPSVPASATTVFTARDNPTVHTRKLQTELMVAALYCGQNARYNAFVRRFEGELVSNGKRLRALFVNMHGAKQAVTRLDTFLTKMANDESRRRLTLGSRYCRDAQTLFTRVLNLRETHQLATFASLRAQSPPPSGRVTLLLPDEL